MNKRFLSVLAFAFIVSGLASVLIYRLVGAKLSAAAAPKTAQTQIPVAARDLQVGTLIKDVDVRMSDWSGPPPKGAISKVQDGMNRGVVTTIFEGEPLLEGRLAPKGAGAGLAATIPVGKRAVAIRVNEVIGVAGFVVPGMRVDIIISGTPPGAPSTLGTLSRIALQNIEVLSAGQQIEKTAEGTPQTVNVVNLLVTPEQAEVLSLANNQTTLQLVLRNPLDTEQAKTTGTATANLFSGTPFRAPAPAGPPPIRRIQAPPPPRPVQEIHVEKVVVPLIVEVFHGAKKAETQFKTKEENN